MIDLAADLAAVFADPFGFGEAATYTTGSGIASSVRAMRASPQPVTMFASGDVAANIDSFLLLTSQVASPSAGATLTIGAASWTLQGVPVRSPDGVTWRVEAYRENAVLLDREITLKRGPDVMNPGATDDRGRPVQLSTDTSGWPTIATVAAAFDSVVDTEKLRAGLVEGRQRARFTIRYAADVAAVSGNDRLILDGEVWQITSAPDLGRRQWIEISAEKIG